MGVVMEVLAAGGILGVAGLTIGLILGSASRLFKVEENEAVANIEQALPGYNCGGCGYPGCRELAEAIVRGEADIEQCKVLSALKNKKK